MSEDRTQSAEGTMLSDTKRMRKYETIWGTIYVPLVVVKQMGDPTDVTFTVAPR